MKISILTPSYNSANYIERAIVSVMKQEFDNFEHIIVDGGSSDNTVNILKKYPHLKWISEKDNGQSEAMNKAFKMSSGDIISYLNADDEYEPGALIKVAQIFNSDKVDFLVGNLYKYTGTKKVLHSPSVLMKDILNYWDFSFPLNPSCYFYKRAVQEKIGRFPESNHYTMDYWFLLRAYYLYQPVKIETVLGHFHYVEGHKSSDGLRAANSLEKDKVLFLKEKYPFKFLYYFLSSRIKKNIKKLL